MGRPINQRFLGANAVHQVQSTTWGAADTGSTPGYLAAQNSPRRFRSITPAGTSVTTFVNGPGNLVSGTSFVKVFPEASVPTTYATGFASLKTLGVGNVASGGIGYSVGDYLLLVGGTKTAAANIQVTSVGTNNAITGLSAAINSGYGAQQYLTLPANIKSIPVTATTGIGVGATVSFNFGVDTANVATGGAGYPGAATYVVLGETVAPVFANLGVTTGAVNTTANLVVTSPGVVNVNPVVVIEGDNAADTEYVSTLTSMNYLNTFQGHRYRWLPKGGVPPANWPSEGVKIAFLDTL